jgi:branched-chain amino acid aminotransferase
MHEIVLFNSTLLGAEEALLPAVSSAAQNGKGVFTTIAIYDGEPFLWERHWRRLAEHSIRVGIDLSPFDCDVTRRWLDRLLTSNLVKDGRARITFFDGSPSKLWPFPLDQGTNLVITTAGPRSKPRPLRLGLSPYRINSASPLAGVKSCNYLEKILALDDAKLRDFDEAVQLNERSEIASACMANIFWRNGGRLFTPSMATGCLAGTTREFVLGTVACEEVQAGIDQLREADMIVLTSAGIGAVMVDEFEGRRLEASNHPILELHPPGI